MKYVIFSIDGQEDYVERMLFENSFRTSKKTVGSLKPLTGSYKGAKEYSYICLAKDFFVICGPWVLNQECILTVTECNKKYTHALYQDGTHEYLGCMKSVTEAEAKATDAWSYREDLDTYFITDINGNDHYMTDPYDISDGVTPEEVSRFHGERIAARKAANGQGRYV